MNLKQQAIIFELNNIAHNLEKDEAVLFGLTQEFELEEVLESIDLINKAMDIIKNAIYAITEDDYCNSIEKACKILFNDKE
jgi:hypothetical protein